MKIRSITAVSMLALMMSAPAFAADVSATSASGNTTVYSSDGGDDGMKTVKQGLTKADVEMREAADDIKAFLVGKNKDGGLHLEPVLIHSNLTAHGLIGKPIINVKGEKIATVKDIIIDKDGKAILVVVSDSGILGIGSKVAAFNYDKVLEQKANGKVVMILSQEMVDHAADFSYDQKDWAKAKVIPTGSISTNTLLQGNVLDSDGTKVADIENIYFRDSEASQLIVGFDKTLGMGGELAALDYDDLKMIGKKENLNFKLTSTQTAQFRSFKKSVAN
jgi:sporulation protein YlmC with PRC-barrel domain